MAESHEESFPAGAVIVEEGFLGSALYIIEKGSVEVIKNLGKPDETILARLEQRNFFGEMCVIESVARSASVRALEPVTLARLTGVGLYHLFQSRPDQYAIMVLNIARDLSRRLRALDNVFAARAH